MNNSKQLLNVARMYCRPMSQSAQVKEVAGPRFKKLKEIQKRFQIDDGVPVYLKAGFGDKFLYVTSVALTAIGLGLSFETFYRITFKD